MFISPVDAINNGWITHPQCKNLQDWQDRKFVSPNAIDFTVDSLFRINSEKTFVISEQQKIMRDVIKLSTQLAPDNHNVLEGSYWEVIENSSYDVMSDMYVNIPEGVAAYLITRSTFIRNGLFLTAGLFDSGFSGNLGCVLHTRAGHNLVAPGTRIGQVIFVKSDNVGQYTGGYNSSLGVHWSEAAQQPETPKQAVKPAKTPTKRKAK